MIALGDQIGVQLAEHGREAIGIFDILRTAPPLDPQPIWKAACAAGRAGEEALLANAREFCGDLAAAPFGYPDARGGRLEGADDAVAPGAGHPEHADGVALRGTADRGDLGLQATHPRPLGRSRTVSRCGPSRDCTAIPLVSLPRTDL